METVEVVNKLKEIQAGMPLHIARIPPDILQKFRNISNDEFCGDYGLCLRECVNALLELREFKKMLFTRYKLVEK